MSDLTHLIERCESGEGSVPRKAGELADWSDLLFGEDWKASQTDMLAEALNGSLDAVISLIEQKLPGWWGAIDIGDWRDNPYGARLKLGENSASANGRGSSPARALLAAFLKAYANKEGVSDGR